AHHMYNRLLQADLCPPLSSPTSPTPYFLYSSGDHRNPPSFPTRRSSDLDLHQPLQARHRRPRLPRVHQQVRQVHQHARVLRPERSEEHTSELQSRFDLVCRLLLEKKNLPYIGVVEKPAV